MLSQARYSHRRMAVKPFCRHSAGNKKQETREIM